MTLHIRDYKPGDAIYTFIDEHGVNTHIDSEKLREWCAQYKDCLDVVDVPIDPKMAKSFLDENAITEAHLMEVAQLSKWDPLIICKFGTYTNGAPDVMLVDGHHRYYLVAAIGGKSAPAYILEPVQWKPFQIEGRVPMTLEELKRTPCKGQIRRVK